MKNVKILLIIIYFFTISSVFLFPSEEDVSVLFKSDREIINSYLIPQKNILILFLGSYSKEDPFLVIYFLDSNLLKKIPISIIPYKAPGLMNLYDDKVIFIGHKRCLFRNFQCIGMYDFSDQKERILLKSSSKYFLKFIPINETKFIIMEKVPLEEFVVKLIEIKNKRIREKILTKNKSVVPLAVLKNKLFTVYSKSGRETLVEIDFETLKQKEIILKLDEPFDDFSISEEVQICEDKLLFSIFVWRGNITRRYIYLIDKNLKAKKIFSYLFTKEHSHPYFSTDGKKMCYYENGWLNFFIFKNNQLIKTKSLSLKELKITEPNKIKIFWGNNYLILISSPIIYKIKIPWFE
jgi:hypothetical protein